MRLLEDLRAGSITDARRSSPSRPVARDCPRPCKRKAPAPNAGPRPGRWVAPPNGGLLQLGCQNKRGPVHVMPSNLPCPNRAGVWQQNPGYASVKRRRGHHENRAIRRQPKRIRVV